MASQRQRKTDHRKTRLNIAPLSALLGEGLFVLFGVFAWPSSADTAAGALCVPLVDGVGEPAARAADGGVRLGELVGADGGGADAETSGHVGDAQVFDGHVSPSFRR